jgi:pSer/pThr/pTyr-binding forkhead associated (FHA) protein
MSLSVLVRAPNLAEARLTFDGARPIVVGRAATCDVQLPDPSVSSRHASVRSQGTDIVVVDEASTNGTFVGGVRIRPRAERIVRSGDLVRLGRMWIELHVDEAPVTEDAARATREIALALVARALADAGAELTASVRVVEGRDQGATLTLAQEDVVYLVGRAAGCALPLADADASREHARVVRRGTVLMVRDAGTKNGTWLGELPVPADRDVLWMPGHLLRIGRTVLRLRQPPGDVLVHIETTADEPMPPDDPVASPNAQRLVEETSQQAELPQREEESAARMVAVPTVAPMGPTTRAKRARGSVRELVVMGGVLLLLVASVVGLVWLLLR